MKVVDRLEPEAAAVARALFDQPDDKEVDDVDVLVPPLQSIAISLKRIADRLDSITTEVDCAGGRVVDVQRVTL